MARHHVKRKLKTYDALSRINHSFAAITRQCWHLERAGFLPAAKLQVFRKRQRNRRLFRRWELW